MRRTLPFALLLAVAPLALAQPGPAANATGHGDEDVDPLGLAAVLLDSRHPDRARRVLLEVDPDADGTDRVRLFTLLGVIELGAQRFEPAARWLAQAIEEGQDDPAVHIYLAKARYGAGDYDGALRALDDAGERTERDASAAWLRAECLLRAGDRAGAWRQLRRAADRFGHKRELRERELTLLAELGLFAELIERAPAWMRTPEEHLRVITAARDAGGHEAAAVLAELARLRFPADARFAVALAHSHAAAGRPLAGARLLEGPAREDPTWAADAAELYRRAGRTADAVRTGWAIPDTDTKLRQRFGILLDEGRFEEAAALGRRLERRGLLQDDALRYGLAYALYRTGRLDDADRHARAVTDGSLFRDATDLRGVIARCREEGWRCR